MRARYTAYTLGGYGDYLLNTWHPQFRGGLTAKSLSQPSRNWFKLEVYESRQEGDRAAIEFKAFYNDENGVPQCHHEISQFLRNKGRWYYTDGRVQMESVETAQSEA